MGFNEYLVARVNGGDAWASKYLKKGKVPLQSLLNDARLNGCDPALIERAERKGMISGDIEMTYEGARIIYRELKDLAKKRSAEGKGEWVDVLDSLDPIRDHEVIANVLFCLDPSIRERAGNNIDSLYRVVLNVGTGGDRKGYHIDKRSRRGNYGGSYLITPELEKIVSSIPVETFNAETEDARRLRAILRKKAEGEVFPVFKYNPQAAFELLEAKISETQNPNLKQTYEYVHSTYDAYVAFNVDVANPNFLDPKTKEHVPLPSLHQKIALYHILHEQRFGVFDGCGTGKTAIGALAQPLIQRKIEEEGREFRRAVIVCPNNAKKTWKQGLMGKDTERYLADRQDVFVVNGEKKDDQFLEALARAKWILMNKEQLNTRINGQETFASHLSRLGVDYLIFDESHNFKSQKGITATGRPTESGAARLLALNVPYLCLLTGTPIPDKLDDYGVLYHLLNPSACPDPRKFKDSYESNPRILHTLFSEKTLRRTSEDLNEDLQWRDNNIDVELDPKQKQVYDHIVEHRPAGWLVQARKCLVDPRLVDPEILKRAGVLGEVTYRNSAKYNQLESLLTSPDGPVARKEKFVIFSSMFREGVTQENHEELRRRYAEMGLSQLYDRLELDKSLDKIIVENFRSKGINVEIGVIDGTRDVEERERTVEAFNNGLNGLLVTTDTGGESISMVAANWAYSLDEDYAPKTEEQKRARLLRKGQTRPVTFVNIRGKDTLDIPLRDYVRKKVVVNTIAVDGMPLTQEEWDLLSDTDGEKFADMVRRGLGGRSINVLEGIVESPHDFNVIKRVAVASREFRRDALSYDTTDAQQLMKWIGRDPVNCWKDPEFVELYMKTLPNLAVPVVHRAKICDIINRSRSGQIKFPTRILSEGSGPSLLYDSYNALQTLVTSAGYKLPIVTDRDFSEPMLAKGSNPNKILGDMTGKNSTIQSASFDMVDNESISLLRNEDEVRSSLMEASRILVPKDGLVELIIKNMRFLPEFSSGMEKLGFEVLSDKNEGFRVSPEFKARLKEELGEHFAEAYAAKLNNTHLILARKVDKPAENFSSSPFWFEPLHVLGNREQKEPIAQVPSTEKPQITLQVSAERAGRKIETDSKGKEPKKVARPKEMIRILPESIPGLRTNGVVTEEI
jgi:superfamily II DNA or RNA helicase